MITIYKMSSKRIIMCLTLMINFLFVPTAVAYSSGAPPAACAGFIPGHRSASGPQSSQSPYTISVSTSNYTANEQITVTIGGSDQFQGFIIKARREDLSQSQDGVGSFDVIPSTTQQACSGAAMTHVSSTPKGPLELNWTAPSAPVGNLVFQATGLKSYAEYWIGITSSVLVDPTFVPSNSSTPTPNSGDVTIDLTECGSKKGCYRNPAGCTGADCTVAATWRRPTPQASYVEIEMIGKQDGWMALGLSKDQKMGDDDVMACIRTPAGTLDVVHTYNVKDGQSNEPLSDTKLGISEMRQSYVDGVQRCRFRREISLDPRRKKRQVPTADADKVFNLFDDLYLLLGFGLAPSGTDLAYHSTTPLVSSVVVELHESLIEVGSDILFLKLHGILMLAAWMLFIHASTIIAKFYKKEWPGFTLCGKAVWFSVHVTLNTFTFACAIAGLVLIFLYIGGYSRFADTASGQEKAHPIIGLVVTGLMVIQPIMAMCRCDPDHDNRYIFNAAHSFVGQAAITLAFVNIFFGMYMNKSESFVPNWVIYTMAAYTVFYSLVIITLEVDKCRSKRKGNNAARKYQTGSSQGYNNAGMNSGKTSDIAMQEVASNQTNVDKGSSPEEGSKFKLYLLAFYVIGSICFYVAMVVGMALM